MMNANISENPAELAAVPPTATPLLTREMSVPEGIAIALEEAGIDLVLGICAGFTTPVFEALYDRPRVRTIQVRQELVASLAANAYGRLTGRPAVIMGEGEFILGTATQGIIESLLGSTPMVIVTEMFDGGRMSHHGNYHAGIGEHGTYDCVAALKAMCKSVFVAHFPAQAVQMMQLAVKHSIAGDPGPVAVILHSACFEGNVGPKSFPRLYASAGYIKKAQAGVDTAAVARAAGLIAAARRPVIVAGHGVRLSGAYDELKNLAAAIDAPVVTTQGGKGVMDEYSPLSGGVFGEWGRESANALVAAADLLLAVGTRLGPLDTVDQTPTLIDPRRQVLVQIDSEPLNAAWTLPTDTVLIGDAAVAMAAITKAYQTPKGGRTEKAVDRIAAAVRDRDLPLSKWHTADTSPLRPERIVALIRELWPETGIVTTDAGESRTYMLNWFKTHGGGRYLVPHGGGGMGYATGAAFGAKLLHPDRAVLAVCGDGGFPMTMNALMNAVQEKVPFTVVVFNNQALGWPMHVTPPAKQHVYHFVDFDNAQIARSMGCKGFRVENVDALRAALTEARTSNVPCVIDAMITRDASYVDATASVAKAERERPWKGKAE
jgi:acetolactate synthase-1/2/3 large subunit